MLTPGWEELWSFEGPLFCKQSGFSTSSFSPPSLRTPGVDVFAPPVTDTGHCNVTGTNNTLLRSLSHGEWSGLTSRESTAASKLDEGFAGFLKGFLLSFCFVWLPTNTGTLRGHTKSIFIKSECIAINMCNDYWYKPCIIVSTISMKKYINT